MGLFPCTQVQAESPAVEDVVVTPDQPPPATGRHRGTRLTLAPLGNLTSSVLRAEARRERELAGDGRAGRWARAKARREQRAFVRRNWKVLLPSMLAMLSVIGACTVLVPAGFLRGFFAGSFSATVVALLAFQVIQSTGTAATMRGDDAEQWTASELRKLRSRGWRVVNHVALTTSDIDHVLIGPGGIYAIETKWSARGWKIDASEDRVRRAAQQAYEGARQLRLWHEIKKHGIAVVVPVVVFWGNGVDGRKGSATANVVDGVTFVPGPEASSWTNRLPSGVLSTSQVEAVWRELDLQVRSRDPHESEKHPLPPSVLALLWRPASALSVAMVAFVIALQAVLTTDSLYVGFAVCAALLIGAVVLHRHTKRQPIVWGLVLGSGGMALLGIYAVGMQLLG